MATKRKAPAASTPLVIKIRDIPPLPRKVQTDVGLPIGTKVRDEVTHFEGVITALAYHITDEWRALVATKSLQDGFMPAARWFSVQRLTPIG